jgi:hypothetical protein
MFRSQELLGRVTIYRDDAGQHVRPLISSPKQWGTGFMPVSRRSALAYAAALASVAAKPVAAMARSTRTAYRSASSFQRVQQTLIHGDEARGLAHHVPLAFAASDTAWVGIAALSEDAYAKTSRSYAWRGYSLRRVNAFQTKKGMRYAAIWQYGRSAPTEARHNMTLAEFKGAADAFAQKGYVLAHVDGCATHAGTRFAAIWEKSSVAEQQMFADLTASEYEAKAAAMAVRGFRPQQIAGYAQDGQARFAAIFSKRANIRVDARHALPAAEYPVLAREMMARGYRLTDASGYVVGGTPFYTAVWEA